MQMPRFHEAVKCRVVNNTCGPHALGNPTDALNTAMGLERQIHECVDIPHFFVCVLVYPVSYFPLSLPLKTCSD
jgi:hypothetical protein